MSNSNPSYKEHDYDHPDPLCCYLCNNDPENHSTIINRRDLHELCAELSLIEELIFDIIDLIRDVVRFYHSNQTKIFELKKIFTDINYNFLGTEIGTEGRKTRLDETNKKYIELPHLPRNGSKRRDEVARGALSKLPGRAYSG
jgi:hypothetical protein